MRIRTVPIDLDRRRYLIYDLSAVYDLEEKYGSFTKAIESLRTDSFEDITILLYYGLLHEDESLTLQQTDQIHDVVNRRMIIEKILQAVSLSLPDTNKEEQTTQNPINTDQPEGWDWDWFEYIGTVQLGMSEAVFWRCTPRRLFALWAIHKRVNGWEEKESPEEANARAWIDQYI